MENKAFLVHYLPPIHMVVGQERYKPIDTVGNRGYNSMEKTESPKNKGIEWSLL